MRNITIRVGKVSMQAELNESPTAAKIWEALPIEASANRWGDEIYFEIPVVEQASAQAREEVEVGELGYWPPGHAFCIFFGPTPVSSGPQPRAYSPINPIGRVKGDPTLFKSVRSGERVYLERAE